MQRRFLTVLLSLLFGTLIGCGSDDDDSGSSQPTLVEQLEAVGVGKYLSRDVPQPTSEGDWLRYRFDVTANGPVCLFGTPYQVFVRPGSSENVLFYLEGGGGCWNEETCFGDSDLGAKETSEPIADLSIFQGILGIGPSNPLDGWNVVYVPYCDGSVFGGDNVVEYERGTVYHRGQVNLSAGLDVMRQNFPDPPEIVVAGSSAGGYGTFSGYGVMRVAFPDKPIYVLNDSGPGLQNNDDQQSIMERSENWQFEQFLVEGCTRCDEQITYLIDWTLENDPNTRVGLFSYKQDFVIASFLMLDRPAYQDLMFDITGEVQAAWPERFKRFFVNGESHTILLGAGVGPNGVGSEGTFASLEIDAVALSDWVADFVVDGPAWRDLIAPEWIDFPSDSVTTFPEVNDSDGSWSVSVDIQPEWDGADPTDASLVAIRQPHRWENRMQLVKNGGSLRFIVTDDLGETAEITYAIDQWVAGESHSVTASWEDGTTVLYVDGIPVGQHSFNGQLSFPDGTPMHIGSDPENVYVGSGDNFRRFQVFRNGTEQ